MMTTTHTKREPAGGTTIVVDASEPGAPVLCGAWAPRNVLGHDGPGSAGLRAVAAEAATAAARPADRVFVPVQRRRRLRLRLRPIVTSIGVLLLALAGGSMLVGGSSGSVEPMVLGATYATTGTFVLVATLVRA